MQTTSCKSVFVPCFFVLHAQGCTHRWSAIDAIRIIRVPFTGSVKLRALLLKAGPGDQTPAKVSLVRSDRYTVAGKVNDMTHPLLLTLALCSLATLNTWTFPT